MKSILDERMTEWVGKGTLRLTLPTAHTFASGSEKWIPISMQNNQTNGVFRRTRRNTSRFPRYPPPVIGTKIS